MRGISVNDDGSHEDHGDILSREMKSRTHSVKVSLLIVQVPVQTERLNPRGTNPARKSLSLYVPFCPVPSRVSCIRIRILLPSTRVSVSTSTHGRSYSVTATRSHIRTQDRKPLPPSYIHRGLCSAPSRPSSFPLATLLRSHFRSRGPEKRRITKIIKSASFRSVWTSRIWPWARSLNLISNPSHDPQAPSALFFSCSI